MDLARRPNSNPMAPSKYRDGFNAQSLGVDLNRKVKEVRKLHPTRSLTILPKQASPWGTCKVYQPGQLFAPELLPSLSRLMLWALRNGVLARLLRLMNFTSKANAIARHEF